METSVSHIAFLIEQERNTDLKKKKKSSGEMCSIINVQQNHTKCPQGKTKSQWEHLFCILHCFTFLFKQLSQVKFCFLPTNRTL